MSGFLRIVGVLLMLGGVSGLLAVSVLAYVGATPSQSTFAVMHGWWLGVLPCLAAIVGGFIVSTYSMKLDIDMSPKGKSDDEPFNRL